LLTGAKAGLIAGDGVDKVEGSVWLALMSSDDQME